MKSMLAGVAAVLCATIVLPAALGQSGVFTWEEVGNVIQLSEGAVVTAPDFRQFKATGFTTFGVQKAAGTPISTITFEDSFAPSDTGSGFEFSLQQIPYGDEMIRQLPAGINEDYLLSDLLIVSLRAEVGNPAATTTYQVTATRVRDPDAVLPIPETSEERFGKVTYETGERRDYVGAPLSCPVGFEYRMVRADQPLNAATTCLCPPACTSETASCDFSGPGRYAISVVPDWLCATDVSTPQPRNEDDPINEKAAIAAGTILSVLFLCCMIALCYLCVNAGPKDEHWNHAPRAPGAIPLPPDYLEKVAEEAPPEPIKNVDGPKAPPRILPDGNPHPYNLSSAPMPPPVNASAPKLMGDPNRAPAPNLASPPLPEPF